MAVTDTINYDTFFTSTTKYFEKELQKNFIEWRPIVNLLLDDYSHKEGSSYAIQTPLEFGGVDPNTAFISPYSHVNTNPTEFGLPGIYPFRAIASSATVSELEMAANSGKAKLFDLFEGRIRKAVRDMVNLVGSECYSDGTSFGGNTFIGLAAGISTTPTADPASGAVGGVPVATNVWWENNATTSAGSFAANGVNGTSTDLVISMYNNCTDGNYDKPTAIISAQNVWEFYNRTLLQTVRYVDPLKTGDLSFGALRYENTVWQWDRQCPSGRMYFINRRGVHFYVDPSMFFKWTPPRVWPDQVVEIRLLLLRLVLVWKMRMFQGVIDGWTA